MDSGKPLVKVEGEEGAQGSGEPGEAMEVKITFPDQLKKALGWRCVHLFVCYRQVLRIKIGIRNEHPGSYYRELRNIFLG